MKKIQELKSPLILALILSAFYFITLVIIEIAGFLLYETNPYGDGPYVIYSSILSFQQILWVAMAIIIIYAGYLGANKTKKLADAAFSGAIVGIELVLAFKLSDAILHYPFDLFTTVVHIVSIAIIGMLLGIVGGLKTKLKKANLIEEI